MRKCIKAFLAVSFLLIGCVPSKKMGNQNPLQVSSIKFLDEYVIPYDLKFKNTWVGGLSGIDYDKKNDQYFIISDERSATSPARFYTAKISISQYKVDTVFFTSVQTLKQPNGMVFPSLKNNPSLAADPESIRFNPMSNILVWSSEGDRAMRNGSKILQDPFVYEMDLEGNFRDSFRLPANMHMQPVDAGPRGNGVFEGTSFDEDYRHLYVSLEEPLFEDGPRADVEFGAAPIRIIKFDVKTHKPISQYAYLLDAVAQASRPASAFKINGVPENLYIGNNKFLVMERSFSTGVESCTIKIFLADLTNATDVSNMKGLHNYKNYRPVMKKLLFNMNDLNRLIDNVEGITLGPVLPNGHQSIVLVADNNFESLQQSQVFLLELIP